MPAIWNDNACRSSMQAYPISNFLPGAPTNIGILMVACGLLNVVMSLLTILWIKTQEKEAQAEYGREDAVKSVIFPVFVKVLWASVIVNLYQGIIIASVPIASESQNSPTTSALFALSYAGIHMVVEGISFLLMQKGCGHNAAVKAGKLSVLWGCITFAVFYIIFANGGIVAVLLEVCWDILVLVFYAVLWLVPQRRLFRRPATILYAKFWTVYRVVAAIVNFTFLFNRTQDLGTCGYIFVSFFFLAIMQPLICYWALLQDSRWWQGLDIASTYRDHVRIASGHAQESRVGKGDIRSPLIGSDFSLHSAQSLASTMDQMRVQGRVKMLNFACIKLDHANSLGAGSFSKVYKGTYRGKQCAIKLIYTVDLTTDVIKRVAAEASILSSIKHKNIVHIYGVSVLPPSVCLILELCSFGSLSDIIRGYGFDWSTSQRPSLRLSSADILHLSLGCASGLAAVHAYDRSICHRDVKSFNFLVDSQFNVKIADLELGISHNGGGSSRSVASDNYSQQGDLDEEGSHSIGSYDLRASEQEMAEEELYRTEAQMEFIRERQIDPTLVSVEELTANWLAPEVLLNRKFIQASDTYALGTVLWEICSGELPYDGDDQVEIRKKILSGSYQHPLPDWVVGTPLGALIEDCWRKDPCERPTSKDVCERLHSIILLQAYMPFKRIVSPPDTSVLLDFYRTFYRSSASASTVNGGGGSSFADGSQLQEGGVKMSHFGRFGRWLSGGVGERSRGGGGAISHSSTGESAMYSSVATIDEDDTSMDVNTKDDDYDNNNGNTTGKDEESSVDDGSVSSSSSATSSFNLPAPHMMHRFTAEAIASSDECSDRNDNYMGTLPGDQYDSSGISSTNRRRSAVSSPTRHPFLGRSNYQNNSSDIKHAFSSAGTPEKANMQQQQQQQQQQQRTRDNRDDPLQLFDSIRYHTAVSNPIKLKMPLPPAAVTAIDSVKEERYWRALEKQGTAWVVVTTEYPHIVLHATTSWYQLFGLQGESSVAHSRSSSTAATMNTSLESLAAILETCVTLPLNMSSSSAMLTALSSAQTGIASTSSRSAAAVEASKAATAAAAGASGTVGGGGRSMDTFSNDYARVDLLQEISAKSSPSSKYSRFGRRTRAKGRRNRGASGSSSGSSSVNGGTAALNNVEEDAGMGFAAVQNVLNSMHAWQQVDSLLTFHLPANFSKFSADGTSTKRFVRHNCHHMMATVHGYPVYADSRDNKAAASGVANSAFDKDLQEEKTIGEGLRRSFTNVFGSSAQKAKVSSSSSNGNGSSKNNNNNNNNNGNSNNNNNNNNTSFHFSPSTQRSSSLVATTPTQSPAVLSAMMADAAIAVDAAEASVRAITSASVSAQYLPSGDGIIEERGRNNARSTNINPVITPGKSAPGAKVFDVGVRAGAGAGKDSVGEGFSRSAHRVTARPAYYALMFSELVEQSEDDNSSSRCHLATDGTMPPLSSSSSSSSSGTNSNGSGSSSIVGRSLASLFPSLLGSKPRFATHSKQQTEGDEPDSNSQGKRRSKSTNSAAVPSRTMYTFSDIGGEDVTSDNKAVGGGGGGADGTGGNSSL